MTKGGPCVGVRRLPDPSTGAGSARPRGPLHGTRSLVPPGGHAALSLLRPGWAFGLLVMFGIIAVYFSLRVHLPMESSSSCSILNPDT